MPPPETVWAHVFMTTPLPNILLLMLDVLPFNLNLLHPLMSHCSRRKTHPTIVNILHCKFDLNASTPPTTKTNLPNPPCRSRQLSKRPVMTSLLRNDAPVVIPYFDNPSQSPLISAVLHYLPSKLTSLQMSTATLAPTLPPSLKMNLSPNDYTVDVWHRIVA